MFVEVIIGMSLFDGTPYLNSHQEKVGSRATTRGWIGPLTVTKSLTQNRHKAVSL